MSHSQQRLHVSAGQFSSCSTVVVPPVRSRHCGCVQQPNIVKKQTVKRYFLTYRRTAVASVRDALVQGEDSAGAALCPEQQPVGSWEWGLEICPLLPGLLSLTMLSPGNGRILQWDPNCRVGAFPVKIAFLVAITVLERAGEIEAL